MAVEITIYEDEKGSTHVQVKDTSVVTAEHAAKIYRAVKDELKNKEES